ncbi:MAG: RidA family protein, partial [Rhodospirillaceae bacterium]|nr:RidA family protein [Rhodospirillaceae bacterium]
MARRYADPSGQWTLKIPVPYTKGVWHDDLIALSGQVDMKGDGIVQHAGDLETQSDIALGHIRTVLADLGAGMPDLTKLVVFYKTDGGVDEDAYRARLGEMIRGEAELAVTFVPLPNLGYPGMMVEIDGYGVKAPDRAMARRSAELEGLMPLGGPFVHGIRCGEMVFTSGQDARDAAGKLLHPGDSVAQSKVCLDATARILGALDADMNDAVKFNAYYKGEGTAEE